MSTVLGFMHLAEFQNIHIIQSNISFEGISESFGKGSPGEHVALIDRFVMIHIRLLNGNGARNAGIVLGELLQGFCS